MKSQWRKRLQALRTFSSSVAQYGPCENRQCARPLPSHTPMRSQVALALGRSNSRSSAGRAAGGIASSAFSCASRLLSSAKRSAHARRSCDQKRIWRSRSGAPSGASSSGSWKRRCSFVGTGTACAKRADRCIEQTRARSAARVHGARDTALHVFHFGPAHS